MTLKLENTRTELTKGWNLAWYHHLTRITCVQKSRGLRKNLMHFVYKLDHLFQSTRVSDEYSSISKAFHFSKLILTQDFCLHSTCNIQRHVLKFETFQTSFVIFHAFKVLFWAKWPCNWKALQLNSEKVETWHGIIIWSTYHVCKSWEDYDKNWMHFVYKLDHLFQSKRVSDEYSSVSNALHFY